MRSLVLDIETTGLFVKDGHRITEIGIVELWNNKPTGKTLHLYFNPERDVPPEITDLTGLTEEFLADKPKFNQHAEEIRDFIGDDPIIITCRQHDDYTLDIAFLAAELEKSAVDRPIPDKQWQNVRPWSEKMFGYEGAKLDNVLDHYGVDRSERINKGHSALLDALLLAKIYPRLLADYRKFQHAQGPASGKKGPSL
ncbi:MAG: exonuclease domain-containing protein [Pseudomonadota bacterium]